MLPKLKACAVVLMGIVFFIWLCLTRGSEDKPPVGLAKRVLEDSTFTWIAVKTPYFRFYYEADTYAARHFAELRQGAEEARLHALELLGEKSYAPTIDLFYLDAREKMIPLIGFRPKGWTEAESNTVLLACNDEVRAYHRHEIMHNLSLNLWGLPLEPEAWLLEGLAVFADTPCLGYGLHEIAAHLQHEQKLIPLDTLINKFREQNDMTAYMESGSLVQFIYENYGRDKLRNLWQQGVKHLSEALGNNLDAIDKAWQQFLQKFGRDKKKVDWQLLTEKGCG